MLQGEERNLPSGLDESRNLRGCLANWFAHENAVVKLRF